MGKGRVVVVGAGPGGLTAALTLEELGYTDVVILEAASDVGGKCRTLEVDGVVFDVGANLTTPRYERIRALAEDVGITQRALPPRSVVPVVGEGQKPPTAIQKIAIRVLQYYYNFLWRRSGVAEPGYSTTNPNLYLPFDQWLKRNFLGPLGDMFAVLFVAYGYGRLMTLPAIYALKFFDPVHLEAAVNVVLEKDIPTTTEFAQGFQQLWREVVRQHGLLVETDADILRIERSTNLVEVQYRQGDFTKRLIADHLVIACPLTAAARFLDVSSKERCLFEKIRTQRYYVLVSRITGLAREAHYIDPYAFNLTPYYPTVIYPPDTNGQSLYVSYAYGGDADENEQDGIAWARKALEETVAKIGGNPPEHLHAQVWNYFPHVPASGSQWFYRGLNALQGTNRTTYVGETFAFTLTELIAEHSDAIIRKHFGPVRDGRCA